MKQKMALSKREVMETWFRRVWGEQNAAAIDELFVPDGQARGLGANTLIGPAGFKTFHSALCAMCENMKITIDKSIEQDGWISMICTFTAKNKQTGEPIKATGACMAKIGDGKIMEAYNHWDFIAIYEQLGLLPQETFATALMGNKVV